MLPVGGSSAACQLCVGADHVTPLNCDRNCGCSGGAATGGTVTLSVGAGCLLGALLLLSGAALLRQRLEGAALGAVAGGRRVPAGSSNLCALLAR